MSAGRLDWWRCWGTCNRKVQEAEGVWLLTGPRGNLLDGTSSRPQPYCRECAAKVPLSRQWSPQQCMTMPTLMDGVLICGKCAAAYRPMPDGSGAFHP
jgi:hypothetical protein